MILTLLAVLGARSVALSKVTADLPHTDTGERVTTDASQRFSA